MYRVQALSDKGIWYRDGPRFGSVDDAMAHVRNLLLRWIIVEWVVIDETGAEDEHGYYP